MLDKPLVIVHTNYTKTSAACFKQAASVCNAAKVKLVVITNEPNFEYLTDLGVEYCNLADYEHVINHKYIHKSQYSEISEKFCIDCWLIVLEYLEKNNLDSCFCIDSDVLILSPSYFEQFDHNADFVGFGGLIISPGTVSVTKMALRYYKETVAELYSVPEKFSFYANLLVKYNSNISDMSIWGDVLSDCPYICQSKAKLNKQWFNHSVVHHTNIVFHLPAEIYYQNDKWYNKVTKQEMYYLHFGGRSKRVLVETANAIIAKQDFTITRDSSKFSVTV